MRFESVNYRSRVYLNGKLIGKNAGAYLPFEIRLPASLLKRGGNNRLVVRVDNRRFRPTSRPPACRSTGTPTGGWWNYGGLLREVYLRKIDRAGLQHRAGPPDLPCPTCARDVTYASTCATTATRRSAVRVTAQLRRRARSTSARRAVGAKKFASSAQAHRASRSPRAVVADAPVPLQHVASPPAPARRRSQTLLTCRRASARSRSSAATCMLNGQPLNFRGFGMHEDSLDKGFAIDNAQPRAADPSEAQGARRDAPAQPLPAAPLLLRARSTSSGMLVWVEVPVYSVKTKYLKQQRRAQARRARARREHARPTATTRRSSSGRSATSSASRPGPVQGDYIQRARQARQAARPDAPGRPTPSPATRRPAASPSTRRWTSSASTSTSAGTPGPNGQIADRDADATTSTASASATPTRRS